MGIINVRLRNDNPVLGHTVIPTFSLREKERSSPSLAGRGLADGQIGVREAQMRSDTYLPDESGHFGRFGGRFVPETLMHALEELEAAYGAAQKDESFRSALDQLSRL